MQLSHRHTWMFVLLLLYFLSLPVTVASPKRSFIICCMPTLKIIFAMKWLKCNIPGLSSVLFPGCQVSYSQVVSVLFSGCPVCYSQVVKCPIPRLSVSYSPVVKCAIPRLSSVLFPGCQVCYSQVVNVRSLVTSSVTNEVELLQTMNGAFFILYCFRNTDALELCVGL